MKRITLLAILCMVIVSTSFSQDFRKHAWGDSMAKVKAVEGDEEWMDIPLDLDFVSAFAFIGNIDRYETAITFYFVEDRLYSGRYFFLDEHITTNSYLTDFERIDQNLQSKYGSTIVEEEWNNDQFKSLPSMWGNAIESGHLVIYTEWLVPDKAPVTEITHSLSGGDYEVFHEIEYFSVELFTELENRWDEENVF